MRTQRVIDNRTLMATACVPLDLPDGREAVAIIVKATWQIDDEGGLSLPLTPAPVRRTPVVRSGENASILHPSDVVPFKEGAEFLLIGTACPSDPGATQMVVSLRIAEGDALLVDKQVQVFGKRVWKMGVVDIVPSLPAAMEPTPLSWENTYGGIAESTKDGQAPLVEKRNPVGSGVAHSPADLVGRPVPPIEDPRAPLSSKRPAPAGFGAISTGWQPRARRFGSPNEAWRRERAPIYPLDFDSRFFNSAPDDQWVERIGSDVNVEVIGVKPKPWRFRLPPGRPRFVATIDGVEETRRPALDTVLIDADASRVELCFRSSFLLPRKSERLESVVVIYDNPLPAHLLADLSARHGRMRVKDAQPLDGRVAS